MLNIQNIPKLFANSCSCNITCDLYILRGTISRMFQSASICFNLLQSASICFNLVCGDGLHFLHFHFATLQPDEAVPRTSAFGTTNWQAQLYEGMETKT